MTIRAQEALLINVGIIGAGGITRSHRAAWVKLDNARVVAVSDLDGDRARDTAEFVGAEQWTTDYHELLQRDDIDAVDICTTESTHGFIAVDAADAGKQIMVEKPIATTIQDADKIIEAAARNKVTLMVAHSHRFFDHTKTAKDSIDAGDIGQPVYIRWTSTSDSWKQDWTGNRVSAGATGGNIITNGCHMTDLLNHLMGAQPVSVYCQARNITSPHLEMNDFFIMTIKYDNGAIAAVEAARALVPRGSSHFAFNIIGTEGELTLGPHIGGSMYQREWLYNAGGLQFQNGTFQTGFDREIAAFVRTLEEGSSPPITGEQGKMALAVCIAAERSLKTEDAVQIAEVL